MQSTISLLVSLMTVFTSDMDESMNSVHSISAMDISPASSPATSMQPFPSNHNLINAFQQQQQKLLLDYFPPPKLTEYKPVHSDNDDPSAQVLGLVFATRTNQTVNEIISPVSPEESNRCRQRIVTDPLSSVLEDTPSTKQSESTSSRRPLIRVAILILLMVLIPYLTVSYFTPSIELHRSTNWQNATEYLSKHLIGQEQGLREFQETMDKHINFSVVLIEVTRCVDQLHDTPRFARSRDLRVRARPIWHPRWRSLFPPLSYRSIPFSVYPLVIGAIQHVFHPISHHIYRHQPFNF